MSPSCFIHMVQVFLFGAYKYPRELTWNRRPSAPAPDARMAFTGRLLRFDQDAYWGLGIAHRSRAASVHRHAVVDLLLGGPIIAGATLSRFFAPRLVVPGPFITFVGCTCCGDQGRINEWRCPAGSSGANLRRRVPRASEARRDPLLSGGDLGGRVSPGCCCCRLRPAPWFRPVRSGRSARPTIIQDRSQAENFFFWWLYTVLSYLPPAAATLSCSSRRRRHRVSHRVPFFAAKAKSWKRRPIAVLVVLLARGVGRADEPGRSHAWSPVMTRGAASPFGEVFRGTHRARTAWGRSCSS